MPVLSFPCVVTRDDATLSHHPRRTWIKGHDLAALAIAATEQLDASPDACKYMLFSPKVSYRAGVFLEVVHASRSALVGPMGGPTPPATLNQDAGYRLSDLLTCIGLGPDSESRRSYPVVVTYSGIFRDTAYSPPRTKVESDRQYQMRCAAAEGIRLERAFHEGIHVVPYDVPPAIWAAHDLERLMALAYQFLPTREPRWRESGAILQEPFGTGGATLTPTRQYCVHIARGDYAAYLRLPTFPATALAAWLETRHCDILFNEPFVKTDALVGHTSTAVHGDVR